VPPVGSTAPQIEPGTAASFQRTVWRLSAELPHPLRLNAQAINASEATSARAFTAERSTLIVLHAGGAARVSDNHDTGVRL